MSFSRPSPENKSFVAPQHRAYIPSIGKERHMDLKEMTRIEQDQLEWMIREAQSHRDRELRDMIVRAAKAVAKFLRIVGESIREAYEAERIRSSSQADAAM